MNTINTMKTTRLGKDVLALMVSVAAIVLLGSLLLGSVGASFLVILGLAFAVPSASSAAVRVQRDLTGQSFSA
jgi:hypothetical protein